MKRVNETLAISAVVVASATVHAGVSFTGTYNFPNTNGLPNPRPYDGSAIANVTPGGIGTSGVTYEPSPGGSRLAASGWERGSSINTGQYFTFSLTAATGYTIDIDTINFSFQRNLTGPVKWQWRSSVDNFAAPLTNYAALATGVTGSGGVLTIPDSSSAYTGNTLSVSGAAFSGLTSVEFRFYAYDSEATGTPFAYLYDELTFSGSVSAPAPVPAPGAVTLLAVAGLAGGRRRRA